MGLLCRTVLGAAFLLSITSFISVAEAKILRYVDDNGITTYTDDEEKASAYDYDSYDDLGQPDPDNVVFRMDVKTHKLYVVNHFHSEITFKVHVSDPSLVESDVVFDHPLEIPGNTEYMLGTVVPKDSTKEITISSSFDIGRLFKGDDNLYFSGNVGPNELIVPFHGSYTVTQGWEGQFTHNGPKSRYAIDVSMPQGTPILAAKDGRVLDMRMSSTTGGPSPSFRPFANYIRVGHSDGTMSIYVHLKGNSQRVAIGDYVKQGQVIALSGNTGYTTGPHLHFTMQANTSDGIRSIKYKLHGIVPAKGMTLSN